MEIAASPLAPGRVWLSWSEPDQDLLPRKAYEPIQFTALYMRRSPPEGSGKEWLDFVYPFELIDRFTPQELDYERCLELTALELGQSYDFGLCCYTLKHGTGIQYVTVRMPGIEEWPGYAPEVKTPSEKRGFRKLQSRTEQ